MKRLGNSLTLLQPSTKQEDTDDHNYDEREDYTEELRVWINGDLIDRAGTPVYDNSFSDSMINAEVFLPQGEDLTKYTVKHRHIDPDGVVAGEFHSNPSLNSIIYDVKFSDGAIKEYAANVIAQNMSHLMIEQFQCLKNTS
uniref:Uncharacterized protein n=1 Tax=Eucampia antarctica TaxID=49252 RepID=A0A7S2RB33_9STRA|mmetsp:Transcript_19826/g.19058  ORF Transcript_19826/g.19058 Transcript_19826/m.19058 type:complete len:141 (+) Transcript_19826:1112-1534(+)|eukprot:CAMPEP_0197842734 /NCGR_PEP_ID=MMETSP1437-20131217/46906_1 /TAXON_ID=49252 ORGANISM="Eucampia antarctica, Strain CCMP1452" /NCGR_SAMPLE_ID=MMETSP1437 /ASSEMBLY_ACC=CAM_ASM_001096 /LENGTH=140 /DNA_ID=CAMNT_0043452659 /DNA_START=2877 /DNA_END=3299 /DNA_ORIENTATION=-